MRHALLLHLIPALLITLVGAQEDWMYESLFGVTDRAILSPIIDRDPEGKASLRLMLNYYKDLERNLTQPQAKNADLDPLERGGVPNFILYYGWPKLNEKLQRLYLPVRPRDPVNPRRKTVAEKKDVERYKIQKRQFERTERLVFKAMAAFGKALDKSRDVVKRTVGWDKVYHNHRQNYTTESRTHKCKMRGNLAFRVNQTWVVLGILTNDVTAANLPENERFYISEYMYIDDSDKVRAQPFFLNMTFKTSELSPAQYWQGRQLAKNRTRATTMMSRFGGRAGIYFFENQPVEDNVAFVAALRDSHELTRQALDSKSASNTAILVFPIFMAAVPIALFADVSDAVTLGYMIFTDVITVLPLAIKGVELIIVGTTPYFSTRSLVYGDINKNGTVVAPTWSVRCTSTQNLTAYGAVFVAVAISAMLLGITLEFLARAKVEKNKRSAAAKAAFASRGIEYVWERKGPCTECECHARAAKDDSPSASQPSLAGGLIGQMQQRRKEASARSDDASTLGVPP